MHFCGRGGVTTDFIPFAGLTGSEDLAPGGVLTQADRETVSHLVRRFIAHHLWDPEERRRHPDHGMPAPVEAALRASGHPRAAGPHMPATVRRRISTWRSLCKWRDLVDPFDDGILGKVLSRAVYHDVVLQRCP